MHSHEVMKDFPAAAAAAGAAARVQQGSSRLHRRARTDAADHRNDRLIIN